MKRKMKLWESLAVGYLAGIVVGMVGLGIFFSLFGIYSLVKKLVQLFI